MSAVYEPRHSVTAWRPPAGARTDRLAWIRGRIERRQLERSDTLGLPDPLATRQAEAGTAYEKTRADLLDHLTSLLGRAKEESFEDGVASDFSRSLLALVERNATEIILALVDLIAAASTSDSVAAEALRWIARINDPYSRHYRLWLLERSLFARSPVVRDGAIIGLSELADKHAVPYLRQAIQAEALEELQADMVAVLRELEEE